MTTEKARALIESKWWVGLADVNIAVLQLNEPKLCMPWEEFHAAVSRAPDRPVYTHEFLEPERLIKELLGDEYPIRRHTIRRLA